MSFVEPAALPADSSSPDAGAYVAAPRCVAPALRLHGACDAGRASVQRFIGEVYARHYSARLTRFMPCLVSLQAGGRICAAAGYRSAREPLFLERYLTRPVEQLLSAKTGQQIGREQIVEVGQFVSARAGEGRRLMAALSGHLADQGLRWVVLTATVELRLILRRLGLAPLTLVDADPSRLGAEATAWGSYYAHAPKVLAGDLASALARFAGRGLA